MSTFGGFLFLTFYVLFSFWSLELSQWTCLKKIQGSVLLELCHFRLHASKPFHSGAVKPPLWTWLPVWCSHQMGGCIHFSAPMKRGGIFSSNVRKPAIYPVCLWTAKKHHPHTTLEGFSCTWCIVPPFASLREWFTYSRLRAWVLGP